MGIKYTLYGDDSFGKLLVCEMSNKLDFTFDSNHLYNIFVSDQMSPEEMAKIFLRGLTICSYWMDAQELEELVLDHMNKKFY